MPTITTVDGTDIYCKDWGTGQPVVFSHGWPLTVNQDLLAFFQEGAGAEQRELAGSRAGAR